MEKILYKFSILFIIFFISCNGSTIYVRAEEDPITFQPGVLYDANIFNFSAISYDGQDNLTRFDDLIKDPYYEDGTIKWSIQTNNHRLAQSFIAQNTWLSKVGIFLSRAHTYSPPYNLVVFEIRESITQPWLIGFTTLSGISESGGWKYWQNESTNYELTTGVTYHILIYLYLSQQSGQHLDWWYGEGNPYSGGNCYHSSDYGGNWVPYNSRDFDFQIWGYPSISLGDAVDNNNFVWTTGGNANWFGQSQVYYYDDDAAQSGDITNSQYCEIKTTITEPGDLKYYWKISSEESYDYLIFFIDGDEQISISGFVDWQEETYCIETGSHEVKWMYTKDGSESYGSDCGWVDYIRFSSDTSPYIPYNPFPADGSTGISINTDLSWSGGDPDSDDTITYDVYFGTSSPPPKIVSNQSSYSYNLPTLIYSTQYYWKIVAWDNHGLFASSPIWDFTTQSEPIHPPTLSTSDASNIQSTSATLNGNLDSLGGTSSCEVWFQWGITTNYDSGTPHIPTSETGIFFANIDSLIPGTTYHFRAVASNIAGTSYGDDKIFTTLDSLLFYFLHITDVHGGGPTTASKVWGPMLEEINEMNPLPAFVIVTGDIADTGGNTGNSPYNYIIDPFYGQPTKPKLEGSRITSSGGGWHITPYNIPVYFCPGNHDSYDLSYRPFCFVNYQQDIADSYYHKRFTIDNYNIDIFSLNSGMDVGWPDATPQGDGLNNLYGNEVTEFPVDIGASTADIKIVLTHHPFDDGTINGEMTFINERSMFYNVCDLDNVDLLCCGHTHYGEIRTISGQHLGGSTQEYVFTPHGNEHIQLIGDNLWSTGGPIQEDNPGQYRKIGVLANGDIKIYAQAKFTNINPYNVSSCFLAGTKITMVDGSKKNIEDIKIGDYVKSRYGLLNKVLPARVSKVYQHTVDEMGEYYLIINKNIRVTPNHPLFTNGKWMTARDVKVGNYLRGISENSITIFSKEKVYQKMPTYNFEVEIPGLIQFGHQQSGYQLLQAQIYFVNGVEVSGNKTIVQQGDNEYGAI